MDMEIFDHPEQLREVDSPVYVAIGMFDGVHLGHQEIIRKTVDAARLNKGYALIISFAEHPSHVLRPEHPTPLIYPLAVKTKVIAETGADGLLLLRFSKEMSRLSPEDFIRSIVKPVIKVKQICVGRNFRFGHKQIGTIDVLRDLGKRYGFDVCEPGLVAQGNSAISSTRIREFIRAGDFEQAATLLGRPYHWHGIVVSGDGRGRQIGFPTANIEVEDLVLPPYGVYGVKVFWEGKMHPGVANLGIRPTFKGHGGRTPAALEVHILDCNETLYGKELELIPIFFLRSEKKFENVEALKAQIQKDIDRARGLDLLQSA